jgi:tetratricopeptide (TPR) repeat protein
MRFRILFALLIASIGLAGCASGPQYRSLSSVEQPVELAEVPFFPQEEYQCGPAALATVLTDAGVDITPDRLVEQIYIPDRRGSLQAELLAATRRQGLVPYLLPGAIDPLIEELHSGRPVLVFQNLRLERWPVWHYAVLIGYEPEGKRFILRSGTEYRQRSAARQFLGTWDRAGRWSMVVASPSEPPASADVLAWLQAVAQFESTGDLASAAQGYEAAVARWPESASAWAALGNARYREERLEDAVMAYQNALVRSADHWTARHNIVHAYLELGCPQRAEPWLDTSAEPPPEFRDAWASALARFAAADGGACEPGALHSLQ